MSEQTFQVIPHNPYRGSIPVVQEFDKRHGENSQIIGGVRLYPDGAQRDEDALGRLQEPPTDPYELARMKYIFHKTMADRARDYFHQTKYNFQVAVESDIKSGHAPHDEGEMMKHLDSVKAFVKAREKLEREALKALEATDGHKRRKAQEIEAAKNRERAQSLKASLQAYEL